MKVLQLSSEKSWRGGEQQIAYLIEELSSKGIDCHVAVRKATAFEEFCISKNIPHLSLPFGSSLSFSTALGIKKYCEKYSIDVIHSHSGKGHSIAFWASVLGMKTPVVVSRRVDFPIKKGRLSRWKYNHQNMKKVLCVSESVKNKVLGVVDDKEKVAKVYSGTTCDKFNISTSFSLRESYNIPAEDFLIGSIAALTAEKDHKSLILAVGKLLKQKKNVRLLIVGGGKLELELKELSRKLGIEDHVVFTGFLNNVPEVLPQLDVMAITSRSEGLGTSILDAFCCQVPVVGTNAGGIPELIINEQTGLLCDVGDVEGLYRSFMRLMDDSKLKNRLVAGANEHLKKFDKKVTAARTLEIYKEILKK
ncbi:glycosyltransferase family 4 protein [Aureibacter tunicatorum]|uniref:Glycosyltransferase involved in cell wall biosynthesis n=1 Tax=Aureibacter tunicatorum TaxID=866807 RepID=A0AAE3XKZ7_9BACT|nr:glycosyltransferase family 4 protein [Aureibacter tunicatorum]MDR6237855.1 glycosyltransferase involved in cell wall biosynthesis [Aureibacter tunicatorum]BDD02890.1 glycosyl transferase [Aureibacter tunicatorum]